MSRTCGNSVIERRPAFRHRHDSELDQVAPEEFGGQLVLSNAPALDLGLGPRPYYRQPSVLARRLTVQRTVQCSASIGQLHMLPHGDDLSVTQ
jgi:hypothetical protein